MATLRQKLEHLLETKMSIRRAISESRVPMEADLPFCEYPDKIRKIANLTNVGFLEMTSAEYGGELIVNDSAVCIYDGDIPPIAIINETDAVTKGQG